MKKVYIINCIVEEIILPEPFPNIKIRNDFEGVMGAVLIFTNKRKAKSYTKKNGIERQPIEWMVKKDERIK